MSTIPELLARLVSYKTMSGSYEICNDALDFVANFLSLRGMRVEQHDINGYQSIVASTRRTNIKHAKVWLSAHIDVVPAAEELFTLRQDGDRLYGRGVFDMKFAIATYLKLVDDLNGQLANYDFAIVITSDEELGGFNGIKALLDKGYRPKVVILPDAGDTPDNWKIERSARGVCQIEIATKGRSAHGSRPWKGTNAIDKLLTIIGEVNELFKNQGPHTSTITNSVIKGGRVFNQVPDGASAVFDIRTVSDNDWTRIRRAIGAICRAHNAKLTELVDYGHAFTVDFANPFIKAFADSFKRQVPHGKMVKHDSFGSGDNRHFAEVGVPCIVASPPGDGYHQPDEYVLASGLTELRNVLHDYLDHVAR